MTLAFAVLDEQFGAFPTNFLNIADIFQIGRLSFFKKAAYRGSLCRLFTRGPTRVFAGIALKEGVPLHVAIESSRVGGTQSCQVCMLLRSKTQPETDVPWSARLVTYVFELGVLGFGLSINENIGIGVLPNGEEFFVGFAGGCVVAH
jgi:hypothetical protein